MQNRSVAESSIKKKNSILLPEVGLLLLLAEYVIHRAVLRRRRKRDVTYFGKREATERMEPKAENPKVTLASWLIDKCMSFMA